MAEDWYHSPTQERKSDSTIKLPYHITFCDSFEDLQQATTKAYCPLSWPSAAQKSKMDLEKAVQQYSKLYL